MGNRIEGTNYWTTNAKIVTQSIIIIEFDRPKVRLNYWISDLNSNQPDGRLSWENWKLKHDPLFNLLKFDLNQLQIQWLNLRPKNNRLSVNIPIFDLNRTLWDLYLDLSSSVDQPMFWPKSKYNFNQCYHVWRCVLLLLLNVYLITCY